MSIHADVVENNVWKLDSEGVIGYLTLAASRDNYQKIIIKGTMGNYFISIDGPQLSGFETFLHKAGLIPVEIISRDIIHENQKIGKLIAHYRNMNIYTFLMALLVIFLVDTIVILFMKINQAKINLEEKVQERTLELENEIFSKNAIAEELFSLKNFLSSILNSMPSMLIGVNGDCQVTHWNRKTELVTGITASKAEGKMLSEIFPELSGKIQKIKESMQSGEIMIQTHRPRQEEGKTIYENLTIYPLETEDQKGAVIRIDNVTKQYRLEEELNHSRKMEAIGQLAGGVAHDLNNMLAGLSGITHLLKKYIDPEKPKGVRYIDMIASTITKTADLTQKLLAFGRKESITFSLIDAHTVIDDTVAILSRAIDKKIKISIDKNAENSTIMGENTALENVLMNLGINASHAMMPRGGTLTIRTENSFLDKDFCKTSLFHIEPGNYIKVEVQDTGAGIPEEYLQKIFEPFFTTKEQTGGSGLGLSTVYGTVQNMHGTLSVESEQGKGTLFTIFLPVNKGEIVTEENHINHNDGSGTILLVDDEETIRITGKEILEGMGYKVFTAENGIKAVEIFHERYNDIDLVILDAVMPEMNGDEALTEIKKISNNSKILISSGYIDDQKMEKMINAGINGFIQKPYGVNKLALKIKEILKTAEPG